MQKIIGLIVFLGLIGFHHCSTSLPFNRWNFWHGGFVGETCFTAPANLNGWIIEVHFHVDVIKLENVWNAVLASQESNRVFILTDIYYNKNAGQGTRVCPGFQGKTNHNIPTTATITFMPITGSVTHGVVPVSSTASPVTASTAAPVTASTAAPVTPPTIVPVTTSSNTGTTRALTASSSSYKDVLGLSILFYEAQRSGKLPADNRISYRGDSALNDRGNNGEDLSGGWYDAGDFVKFNLPMASSTTMLLWGLHRFKDAYVAAGELENMYSSVRWPLDYFLKCWIPEQKTYYYQVGDAKVDHSYWGRPEDMTMNRPALQVNTSVPGSDVAGETAAAMAVGSIVFETEDPSYSSQLLEAAESLYEFAKTYQGKYPLYDFYVSSGYKDELCIAAMWLYKATGDPEYITDAKSFVSNNAPWALSWDNKFAACQLLLFEETGEAVYKSYVENFFNKWTSGNDIPYTPCGLAFRTEWGSLRYSGNAVMLALVAAEDGIKSQSYRAWALGQINYMLGDNKLGMSYVIGFTDKYPLNPHHASSSCPSVPDVCNWSTYHSSDTNHHVLYGALVGGPDASDNYVDDRTEYEHSEVACDYNAGFQSAIAGIIKLKEDGILPVAPSRNC